MLNRSGWIEHEHSEGHIFDYDGPTSKDPVWWQSAEPLWTTATRLGHKVFLAHFSSCDVPFKNILPTECTGYYGSIYSHLIDELHKAILKLFLEGFTLAMVYHPNIDDMAHQFGQNSQQLLDSLIETDLAVQGLLYHLKWYGLEEQVNVVITSDHGHTDVTLANGTKYVYLKDYIDDLEDVYGVIDYGPWARLVVMEGKIDKIYNELKRMPGVQMYKHMDIPEHFHFKRGHCLEDIYLLAKPKYFIVGLEGAKQIGIRNNCTQACVVKVPKSTHGYYNVTDMRSIFFARGPGNK